MGKAIVAQKSTFIEIDESLASMNAVSHLYNFRNIQNRDKVTILI